MESQRKPNRRPAFGRLAIAAAAITLLAACGAQSQSTPSASPTQSPSSTATSSTLPPVTSWQPSRFDTDPDVKRRAAQLIEALGTWSAGQSGQATARTRVAGLGLNPKLAGQAGQLLNSAPQAVLRVIDVQYGGILSSTANALVVEEQWLLNPDGSTRHTGLTVQVLLDAARPRWTVTSLIPADPKPPATHPGQVAASVLANPRIHLPFAAAADVRSGSIDPKVLTTLNTLARSHVLDVSVVESGHPINVFGTDRKSNHPQGLAVDIWALDGRPVIDPANRALVLSVMRQAATLGPYQVGGPEDLDGDGLLYFSDNTHQDHIHLGFHP